MAPFPSPAASAAGLGGRQEEKNIPGLNLMKINISAVLAADGAPFREQQVQLILQELELFALAQSPFGGFAQSVSGGAGTMPGR